MVQGFQGLLLLRAAADALVRKLLATPKPLHEKALRCGYGKFSLKISHGRTWCTDTMSPSLTLRLLRTVLFIRILASSTVSSTRTMHTVSLRFLPCAHMGPVRSR